MSKKRVLTLGISFLLLGLVGVMPATVAAQDATPVGGGKATDYQPPTRNPQGNTATGLQTGASDQNLTSPTSFNQTNLPSPAGLQVVGAHGQPVANTTKTFPAPKTSSSHTWLIYVIGGLALIGIIYAAMRPKRGGPKQMEETINQEVVPDTPTTSLPKKKSKKTRKKKHTKR